MVPAIESGVEPDAKLCFLLETVTGKDIAIYGLELVDAAAQGSRDGSAIHALIDMGAPVEPLPGHDAHTLTAALEGTAPGLAALLTYQPDTTVRDRRRRTLLMRAAQSARDADAKVRTLLDAGAEIEAADPYGSSALLYATRSENFEAAEVLVRRGADVHVVDGRPGHDADGARRRWPSESCCR